MDDKMPPSPRVFHPGQHSWVGVKLQDGSKSQRISADLRDHQLCFSLLMLRYQKYYTRDNFLYKPQREEEGAKGKVEKDKEKESLPAKMEKPEAGQCGTIGETKAAGLVQGLEQGASGAEGAGTGSEAQAQPKRTPELGAPSEGLGPAEGPPELEDKTSGEALEEVSCREQGVGSGQENSGEGNIPPESFTPGEDEELGGGAEIAPCPKAARDGSAAPLEQCSKEQGHDQP